METITIPLEEYNRHLAAASNTGNYFMFRECYLKIMSRDAALVLQKIINKITYLHERDRIGDGWVLCTIDYLENSLAMNEACQQRVLRELKAAKFIEVSRASTIPPKRTVRVNFHALNIALDDVKTQTHRNLGVCKPKDDSVSIPAENCGYNSIVERTKNESCPPTKVNKRLFVDEQVGFLDKLTSMFHNGVQKKLYNKDVNINQWKTEFTSLVNDIATNQQLSQTEAQSFLWDLLVDHIANLGSKRQPLALSPKTVRNKFASIVMARDIRKEQQQSTKQQMEVSEEVSAVVDTVKSMDWPASVVPSLSEDVQKNVNFVKEFSTKLEVLAKCSKDSVAVDFANHLLMRKLISPEWFVGDWLSEVVNPRLIKWEGWNSGLPILGYRSKWLKYYGEKLAREEYSDVANWSILMTAMKEEGLCG